MWLPESRDNSVHSMTNAWIQIVAVVGCVLLRLNVRDYRLGLAGSLESLYSF